MAGGARQAPVRRARALGGAALIRLAVLGDVHGCFDAHDVRHLDAAGYDAILAVGDISDRLHLRMLEVARRMAALRTPLLLLPGNHDGPRPLEVLAETFGPRRQSRRAVAEHTRRIDELCAALQPHVVCGYSRHTVAGAAGAVDVIAARPHAMDGRHLTFAGYLGARFGVTDLASSTARLRALVDACTHPIVFLAHNGPSGLGPGGPWGMPRLGRDNGDPDLADAVAYARACGKRVVAVVAGHMHLGGGRPWRAERGGIPHVNAARVPRIWRDGARVMRHHVCIVTRSRSARVEPVEAWTSPAP